MLTRTTHADVDGNPAKNLEFLYSFGALTLGADVVTAPFAVDR